MLAAFLMLITTFAVQAPADTLRYQVVNHGRPAGTMEVVTVADTIVVHVHSRDRERETDATTRYVTDETETIVRLEVSTAVRPDPFERFALADGTARWRTPVDSATAAADGPAFYWPRVYNEFDEARLAAFVLQQRQRTADLLPFHAPASADVAVDTVVSVDGRSERVRRAGCPHRRPRSRRGVAPFRQSIPANPAARSSGPDRVRVRRRARGGAAGPGDGAVMGRDLSASTRRQAISVSR